MNKHYPVTKSFLPPLEEYIEELKDIWESHWLTNNGTKHKTLEEKLKVYLDSNNISLFTNGHLALDIAIKALNLDGEIITTPFTFASTTHAITMNNIKPVFCDIKENDYTIDEKKIESLITDKTSAILAVHVYGNPCAVHEVEKIAHTYNIKVIYDAAHAFGESIDTTPISQFGDMSMFSFHATKVFHTIEGGALAYPHAMLKKKLDLLKNFGISGPEDVETIGLNAKMNEFQAAMGLVNLRYIDSEITKRKIISELYDKELGSISGIKINKKEKNISYNYAYYPILIDKDRFGISRDELFNALVKNNIVPRKYFYPLITDFACYKNITNYNVPIAKKIAHNVLTLPLYTELKTEDVLYICDAIKREKK